MKTKAHKQAEHRPEAELFKQVRAITLSSRRKVDDHLSGNYQSAFKGRGMEFDQVREYVVGDDPRHFDWMVTARTGEPFTKTFIEERELSVFFAVDGSKSRQFGAGEKTEYYRSIELFATLALSGMRKNDAIGLVIFTDQVEVFIPPKKGKQHFLRLIRELLNFEPSSPGTDLEEALLYCNKALHRRGIFFLISDFLDPKDYSKPLRHLAKRQDFVAIETGTQLGPALHGLGLLNIEGLEGAAPASVDTNQLNDDVAEEKTKLFRRQGADYFKVDPEQSLNKQLGSFFRARSRRR